MYVYLEFAKANDVTCFMPLINVLINVFIVMQYLYNKTQNIPLKCSQIIILVLKNPFKLLRLKSLKYENIYFELMCPHPFLLKESVM